MLKKLRHAIITQLWRQYRRSSRQIQLIEQALQRFGIHSLPLDHFAVIDLPGPQTGIHVLRDLFAALGFSVRGQDYLPDKQNDFLWLAESDSDELSALDALPQVVVADFRLDEMPPDIRAIIEKYARLASPTSASDILHLIKLAEQGDASAFEKCTRFTLQYLSGRDWPLPTVQEFNLVHRFNELLAWVLVFGRRPNHFTLSVHLLPHFSDLAAFHRFIEDDVKLPLNREGQVIKGGKETGIAQGSTAGSAEKISLADGAIYLPADFVEFVWRYPENTNRTPLMWNDYYTGFIAQHANRVIESLFT